MRTLFLPDSTLGQAFAARALLTPDAPALVLRGETFSYGNLDLMARRWARAILQRIDRPAQRIGVFGSRSRISYNGVLAALYAGATFVPLNPRFPADRTRRMAESARLDAILVDSLAARQPEALPESVPVFHADTLLSLQSGPGLERLPEPELSSIAYLLFTSGSTGIPKGVPITHSNVRAYLNWAQSRYKFHAADRFSQTFDQTFDLSVHDQFLCWESGASLYPLTPTELLAPSRVIQRNELSVWFSVPSVVAQMRKRKTILPDSFPSLRWSLFCGEPLPQASAEAWQAAAPHSIVENLYGPTELTIACTVHRWHPVESPSLCLNGMLPIGRPFPGLTAQIREDELCVAGPQTSPGYWLDPVKTADSFLDLPEGRFYRTGDRVQILPNGELACLGRVDHQIKVLGFRVELGEIEAVLQADPQVVQAVALGWPISDGTAQGIVAFVSGQDLDLGALRLRCQASLADYMVPAAIHIVPAMPLNANGKMDRPALLSSLAQAAG